MDTHTMHTEGQAHISELDDVNMPASSTGLDTGQEIDVEALRAEVTKWQERVPKLAKALRERTDELAQTREELRAAHSTPSPSAVDDESADARLAVRNQLITELQQKVTDLGDKHRKAAGELHSSQLDLENAREEAGSWQTKWQEATTKLDGAFTDSAKVSSELEQAKTAWQAQEQTLIKEHSQSIERLNRDSESLRSRNTNLGETIEFANKQIATLGEDMASLVEQGQLLEQEKATSRSETDRLNLELEELKQRSGELQSQLQEHEQNLSKTQSELGAAQVERGEYQDQIQTLEKEIAQASAAADQVLIDEKVALEQAARELEAKLEVEDERYASAMQAADDEQTQLVKLLDDKDERIKALQAELDSHSQSRTSLEQELEQIRSTMSESKAKIEQGLALTQDKQQQLDSLTSLHEDLQQHHAIVEDRANSAESSRDKASADRDELQTALDQLQIQQADSLALANAEARKTEEQIESLQEELKILRDEYSEHRQGEAERLEEIESLRADQNRWVAIEQDLLEQVNAVTTRGEEKQQELDDEIKRLNECVVQAQDSHKQREDERRELVDKVGILEEESSKLKSNLAERSALVRELEDERKRNSDSQTDAQAEFSELSQQLTEARHKLTTFQEHAEKLEVKLQTSQDHLSDLEAEMSESQEERLLAVKGSEHELRGLKEERNKLLEQLTQSKHHSDDLSENNVHLQSESGKHDQKLKDLELEMQREQQARKDQQNAVQTLQAELEEIAVTHKQEVAVLKTQLDQGVPSQKSAGASQPQQMRELEQLLRERTQELDKMRWRLEQQPSQGDDQIVLVLNQQLDDARAENKRLMAKLANPESSGSRNLQEDLTELKGIGDKLAEQLNELGVITFAQLAALDIGALEAEDHPLHSFRSRVIRDEWIKQAKSALKRKN